VWLKNPAASPAQAGHQDAPFEQCLKQCLQVERLPLGFCEQPRSETLRAQAACGELDRLRGRLLVAPRCLAGVSWEEWLRSISLRQFANDLKGILRRERTQFQARQRDGTAQGSV
jgi:hypothetical protein